MWPYLLGFLSGSTIAYVINKDNKAKEITQSAINKGKEYIKEAKNLVKEKKETRGRKPGRRSKNLQTQEKTKKTTTRKTRKKVEAEPNIASKEVITENKEA